MVNVVTCYCFKLICIFGVYTKKLTLLVIIDMCVVIGGSAITDVQLQNCIVRANERTLRVKNLIDASLKSVNQR